MQHRSDGERGQVIIVAALVIAAVFVGLALVLNSGIYAENLSSRETTDAGDALTFSSGADRAVAEAYERTNAADETTADDARATFNGTVDDWGDSQRRRAARRGTVAELERTPHVGWRLEQDADRNFTSAAGADDWQLADDADDVAEFELNVTRDDLYHASDWDDVNASFHVEVSETDDWELYVFRNDTHVIVHEGAPGGYPSVDDLPPEDTCAESESRAVVDFRAKTLAGSDCEPLNFSDDLDGPVDVSFRNATRGGEQINGTYAIVVNGSGAAAGANFAEPPGDGPTAQAVVYSASYATDYRRSDLRHVRDVRYMVREESYRAD